MSTRATEGYLVLSDISGFTAYVAQTELEHSQEVLTELLELIVSHCQPLLTLVKLEGDAVFAYAPQDRISRSENLLELIEATYVAFRRRVDGIVQRTTCQCNACRALPTLDLKFLVHFGSYMVQSVSGINDLVGSDVNLIHRLAKNHITEHTGWNAYALFSGPSMYSMNLSHEGFFQHVETYEHLGDMATFSMDLRARYKELTDSQHNFVSPEESDIKDTFYISAPPPVVWDWLTDPLKRTRYFGGASWSAVTRPGGRTGAGATNHCAHGKGETSVENILDWRPFDYYTSAVDSKLGEESMIDYTFTYRLEPDADGQATRVYYTMKLKKRNPIALMMHNLRTWNNSSKTRWQRTKSCYRRPMWRTFSPLPSARNLERLP
jgi:carbon monoxide dehydrogenase subunit G